MLGVLIYSRSPDLRSPHSLHLSQSFVISFNCVRIYSCDFLFHRSVTALPKSTKKPNENSNTCSFRMMNAFRRNRGKTLKHCFGRNVYSCVGYSASAGHFTVSCSLVLTGSDLDIITGNTNGRVAIRF